MVWRRRGIFDLFDYLLRDIERELSMFEEELERVMEEAMRSGNVRVERFGPYVYGFSISIGPDGRPVIREFGNVRRGLAGAEVKEEEFEPLVDVMEEDDKVTVVAELPGAEKDKIKVKVGEDYVEIRARNGKKYYKRVALPTKVKPETAKARFNNGVLEIVIEKKEKKKKEGEVELSPE
ncbi:archaeal heat shock protein Hsp20 [Ignicoccus hospitalis]|nr:archaeal heat shock protein Hsp20 [Ignicoccus hospitalis]HIH90704.1 Hsp20/alpha crystallin family protein [Desulfurococcaceae archaeon]